MLFVKLVSIIVSVELAPAYIAPPCVAVFLVNVEFVITLSFEPSAI